MIGISRPWHQWQTYPHSLPVDQLQIASWLGVGPCTCFASFSQGFVWFESFLWWPWTFVSHTSVSQLLWKGLCHHLRPLWYWEFIPRVGYFPDWHPQSRSGLYCLWTSIVFAKSSKYMGRLSFLPSCLFWILMTRNCLLFKHPMFIKGAAWMVYPTEVLKWVMTYLLWRDHVLVCCSGWPCTTVSNYLLS